MGSCPQSLPCTQGLKEHPCTLCMHPPRRAHVCHGTCLHMRVCTNPAPRHPRGAPLAPEPAGEQRAPQHAPCTPPWISPVCTPLPKAFGHQVSSSAASKAQARGLHGPPSACPWAQLEGVPGLQGVQIRGCRGPGHGSARLGVPSMLLLASSPVRGEGEQRVEPEHGQTREL